MKVMARTATKDEEWKCQKDTDSRAMKSANLKKKTRPKSAK